MPDSNDYKAAAKIIRTVASENIATDSIFRLFLPMEERTGFRNMFRRNNYNWGKPETDLWNEALKARGKKIKEREKKPQSARLSELDSYANDLEKIGSLAAMIESAMKSEILEYLDRPSHRALMLDYLFLSVEPRFKVRHKRLTNIFSLRISTNDEQWVKAIWDYTRLPRAKANSEKLISKYLRG